MVPAARAAYSALTISPGSRVNSSRRVALRLTENEPKRVRRSDPGDPSRCPVWQFHVIYSDDSVKQWVQEGCRSAGIGCLECKQPVIDAILREQQPWRDRAETYLSNPKQVHWIVEMGTERARTVARQTSPTALCMKSTSAGSPRPSSRTTAVRSRSECTGGTSTGEVISARIRAGNP